jgi:thioredoxin reductase/NAD-dependent dihydropyrimidine dehydrogenase PreA subunit
MNMLLTTFGFLFLTALLVRHHLNRTQAGTRGRSSRTGAAGAVPSAPGLATGAPCPRCSAPVPAGSAFCPGCGVPQQIYEVVNARVAAGPAGAGPRSARHAMVRADVCVGCGTCVAACPEMGAIELQGKLAVVNTGKCKAHAECVAACPVGAILMGDGRAVHRIEVPEISPDFQTNVPGLYIVGELGGRALIKNAINEGTIAVEHIARELSRGPAPPADGSNALDLIIVGSGPAGLSAGLQAVQSKLSYAVLEQGDLADSIRKYPRHKILLSEPVSIPLYGDLWVADGAKETLLQVWETIISNTGLKVLTGHRVDNVVRKGPLFCVRSGERELLARRVVLAMGRRGTPRRLGCPGEQLAKVYYDILEMETFQGRRVLVVGGGDTAVESAVGLANQPGTRVVLSYRGDRFERAKERNRKKLEEAVRAKRLGLVLRSQLREIRPDAVVLETGGQPRILPNDDVIIRIGGEAPHGFLERVGVRIVEKDVPIPTWSPDAARAS